MASVDDHHYNTAAEAVLSRTTTITKRRRTTTSSSLQQQQQQQQNRQQPHQSYRRRRRRRPTPTPGGEPTLSSLSSSSNYGRSASTSVVLSPLSFPASSSSSSASASASTSTSVTASSLSIVQTTDTANVSGGVGVGGDSDDGPRGPYYRRNSGPTAMDTTSTLSSSPGQTPTTNTCSSSWTAALLLFGNDVINNDYRRPTTSTNPNNISNRAARQRIRRKYGVHLARSRTFNGFNNNSNENYRNSAEVIFRNGQGGDTTPNAYVGCIFLGGSSNIGSSSGCSSRSDGGKVLAMDCTGRIDIVDLGGRSQIATSTIRSSSSRSRSRRHHHHHTRIDFAHYLANNSHNERSSSMNGSIGSSGNNNIDFSSVFLRGYGNSNGNSSSGASPIVAIGMTNDNLCLLELEDSFSSNITSPTHRQHHHYYHHHPRNSSNTVPQTYIHQSSSGGTTTTPSPFTITNVREVWSTQQHQQQQQQENRGRMFYRDRRNDRLVLREQLRKRQQQLHNNDYYRRRHSSSTHTGDNILNGGSHDYLSDLIPISHQRDMSSTVRFVPHLCPSMKSQWDVLETRGSGHLSSSCYHVAHVDSGSDCFWWQIFDGRTTSCGKNNNNNSHNNTRPKLLVDVTSTDRPTKREEHITSVAVVSDICLATSHISCPSYGMTPAHEIFDRDLPYCGTGMESCIKLWDLRMMSCSSSASSCARQQYPITTIPINSSSTTTEQEHYQQFAVQLPSFPDFDAYGVEPVETINGRLSSKGSLRFKDSTARPYTIKSGKIYSEGGDRNNIITPGGGSGGCDYVITELSAMRQSGNSNFGSTAWGNLLITCTSRSRSSQVEHHSLDLGRMEVTERPVTQTNQTLACHPVFAIDDSWGHNDSVVCYSRLPSSSYLDVFNVLDDDDGPSSRLDLHLTDRYGTETDLSCLSMNGTTIVGGSADGDLFVWR